MRGRNDEQELQRPLVRGSQTGVPLWLKALRALLEPDTLLSRRLGEPRGIAHYPHSSLQVIAHKKLTPVVEGGLTSNVRFT